MCRPCFFQDGNFGLVPVIRNPVAPGVQVHSEAKTGTGTRFAALRREPVPIFSGVCDVLTRVVFRYVAGVRAPAREGRFRPGAGPVREIRSRPELELGDPGTGTPAGFAVLTFRLIGCGFSKRRRLRVPPNSRTGLSVFLASTSPQGGPERSRFHPLRPAPARVR
jgi:hypothetical protein